MYNLVALLRLNHLLNQMALELGILILLESRNPLKYKTMLILLLQCYNTLEMTAGGECKNEFELETLAEENLEKIISQAW